jgi:hypothetical protein
VRSGVIEGPRLFDGFPFHLEIDSCVLIGRAGVSEPLTDRDDVAARSEQMHGRTVSINSTRRINRVARQHARCTSRRPCETIMRHNARQERAQVLSTFLASVPKLRGLSSQRTPDFWPNLSKAAV